MSDDDMRLFARMMPVPGMWLELKSAHRPNFSNLIVCGPATAIAAVDEPGCKTHLRFEIPSALYGVPANAEINGVRLSFSLRPRNLPAICETLRIDQLTEETHSISLMPDSKGKTNVTTVEVELEEHVILHALAGQLYSRDHGADGDVAGRVIRPLIKSLAINAMAHINEFLDVYSLAMNNRSLQRISCSDVVRIEVWQTLHADTSPLNIITLLTPFETACRFNDDLAPDPKDQSSIAAELAAYTALDAPYRIARRYLAEAYRAFDSADYAMACIHAIKSCEEAGKHYVAECLNSPKVSLTQKKALKRARSKSNHKGSFWSLLNEELPVLCRARVDYPGADVKLCDDLRQARNDAMHDIRAFRRNYKQYGLNDCIDATKRYVDYLIGIHPH